MKTHILKKDYIYINDFLALTYKDTAIEISKRQKTKMAIAVSLEKPYECNPTFNKFTPNQAIITMQLETAASNEKVSFE